MNVYSELEQRGKEIHDVLERDYTFSHDEHGGVVVDVGGLGDRMRDVSSGLSDTPRQFVGMIAEVIKEASRDSGFSQIRLYRDEEFGRQTISFRGGFPAIPSPEVSFEKTQRIMSRRSGIDVTVASDRLYVESVLGFIDQGRKHDISLTGDINWGKSAQIGREKEIPSEKEIRCFEARLGEFDRLTIADALLTLASNEVEQVINS